MLLPDSVFIVVYLDNSGKPYGADGYFRDEKHALKYVIANIGPQETVRICPISWVERPD